MNPADLVAQIGGLLGLFTGLGFLSLIEIIEIVDKIVLVLIRDNKRKANSKDEDRIGIVTNERRNAFWSI